MTENLNDRLRSRYSREEFAIFADKVAAFRKNPSATSVDSAARFTELNADDARMVLKTLCDDGAGEWVVGRRGKKTRAKWRYSISDIGLAMKGQKTLVEQDADTDLEDHDEDDILAKPAISNGQDPQASGHLSVDAAKEEAKRLVSQACGVAPESVEIVVRF